MAEPVDLEPLRALVTTVLAEDATKPMIELLASDPPSFPRCILSRLPPPMIVVCRAFAEAFALAPASKVRRCVQHHRWRGASSLAPSAVNAFGACWLVLQWARGVSVALCDIMGKGKTHTVLLAAALWAKLGWAGCGEQVLIVCPSKLRVYWRGEAQRWAPSLRLVEPQA